MHSSSTVLSFHFPKDEFLLASAIQPQAICAHNEQLGVAFQGLDELSGRCHYNGAAADQCVV